MKQGYIYTLELEDGFWYVGYSEDTPTRIASHFLGAGAKWTKLHRPVRVSEVRPGCRHLENLVTISLMCIHGHEKVRGGGFTNVEMKTPTCIQTALKYAKPAIEDGADP